MSNAHRCKSHLDQFVSNFFPSATIFSLSVVDTYLMHIILHSFNLYEHSIGVWPDPPPLPARVSYARLLLTSWAPDCSPVHLHGCKSWRVETGFRFSPVITFFLVQCSSRIPILASFHHSVIFILSVFHEHSIYLSIRYVTYNNILPSYCSQRSYEGVHQ